MSVSSPPSPNSQPENTSPRYSVDLSSHINNDINIDETLGIIQRNNTKELTLNIVKPRKKRKKKKCNICKKKLGLMPLRCRCKRYFCALHRYAEDHECDYDYKTIGKAKIRKENPKVIAEKIIRI